MSICLPTNQTIEDFLTAAKTSFTVTITEESSNEQQAQEEMSNEQQAQEEISNEQQAQEEISNEQQAQEGSSNEQQEKSNVKSSTSKSSKIARTMTERTGLKMKHSISTTSKVFMGTRFKCSQKGIR